jgi:hypothetical protein
VKKRLAIALATVVLAAAATSLAVAGSYQRSRAQVTQVTSADALPAYEVLNSVRSLGLRPTTQALRRGPYYVLHALDRRGVEMRVVADAQLGDIVSVAPVLAPRFNGGPRIIHVPQPGERDDRASTTYDNDDNSAADDKDDTDADQPAPPPRRPPLRRPYQRMEAPPARASVEPPPGTKPARKHEPKHELEPEPKPLGPPRAVLSAPPPPAGTALTPIYPTPKFDAKSDTKSEPSEKFSAPERIPPPPGYTPPAAPRG